MRLVSRLKLAILFIVILAANLHVLLLYRGLFPQGQDLLEQDFLGYYTAANLPPREMYDIDRQRQFQTALLGEPYGVPAGVLLFNHPPILVPAVKLISTNDYVESYRRWAVLLSTICLLCSAVIYLLLRDAGQTVAASALSAFTALLFFPVFRSVVAGQDTPFVLLGALLWAFFLSRKEDAPAGLALALTVIKPQLALPLAAATFAVSRRSFVWFAAGAAALTALSMLYVGLQGVSDLFVGVRLSTNAEALGVLFKRQYNFAGLPARFGVGNAGAGMVAWFAFIAATLCLAFRGRNVGVAVVAAVFFSPNLHAHDLALLLVPATLVACGLKPRHAPLAFFPASPALVQIAGWTIAAYVMQAAALALSKSARAFHQVDDDHMAAVTEGTKSLSS